MSVLVLVAACTGDPAEIPFKALDHYLGIRDGDTYRPIFVKGVNLGTGIPGSEPGELAIDYATYLEWFEEMGDRGFNALRVYTLHYPRMYEAFFAYNNLHPERPLYLIQNVWLDEENPTGGFDLFDFSQSLDQSVEEVVSAIHGDAEIPHRLGRAFGTYDVDVSDHVLAWIVGRETYAGEILLANQRHPEVTSFVGSALRIDDGTPAQVWATERLDALITYERVHYGVQRPVALSNWPTTDPLHHPSEPHFFDENTEIESIGGAGEDDATLELTNVDTSNAPAGLYASYHVYPYYPNFIYRDPAYATARDAEGANNYIGYLQDLKEYYGTMPLLISEFGIPSSWGRAHDSPVAGMHHGGHVEAAQADILRRMGQNIYDAGCAGELAFSWMDEWWKRTWITSHRTLPSERLPLWFDVTSPEQNYGLLTYELGTRNFDTWPAVEGLGRLSRVAADFDAAYFHLEVELRSPLSDGETLTIGFDTYDDELGESVLPGTIPLDRRRAEFALVVGAPDSAQLYVTESYDLFGVRHGQGTEAQVARSTATDGAPWHEWRWITNIPATSDDGALVFPQVDYNMGALRARLRTEEGTSQDAVVLGDTVRVRIPWTLLHFSDPSAREVLHDDLSTEDRVEVRTSDGIAVAVALGDELLESERFSWPRWDDVPGTFTREKPALSALEALYAELPDSPPSP